MLLAFGAVVDSLGSSGEPGAGAPVAQAGAGWARRLVLEVRNLGRRFSIAGPASVAAAEAHGESGRGGHGAYRRTRANGAGLSAAASMPKWQPWL